MKIDTYPTTSFLTFNCYVDEIEPVNVSEAENQPLFTFLKNRCVSDNKPSFRISDAFCVYPDGSKHKMVSSRRVVKYDCKYCTHCGSCGIDVAQVADLGYKLPRNSDLYAFRHDGKSTLCTEPHLTERQFLKSTRTSIGHCSNFEDFLKRTTKRITLCKSVKFHEVKIMLENSKDYKKLNVSSPFGANIGDSFKIIVNRITYHCVVENLDGFATIFVPHSEED